MLGAAWRTGGVSRITTASGFWIERVSDRWRASWSPYDSPSIVLESRAGALWCLDARGALARRDGSAWQEIAGASASSTLTTMLAAMQRDGGLPVGDALLLPRADGRAVLRVEPSGEVEVWRYEPESLVRMPERALPLRSWSDGRFTVIAAARLATGALRLVDRGGGVIDVDAAGVQVAEERGSLRRQLRHVYPDPDPNEVEDGCLSASITAEGSVWTLRASGVVEGAHPSARGELARDRRFRALAVDGTGSVWAIGGRAVTAVAGPSCGERFAAPMPAIVGSAGVDRIIESVGDVRRTVSLALGGARAATLGGVPVALDDVATHDGRTWRVLGQGSAIVAYAEHEESATVYADPDAACPRGLVSTGAEVFLLSETAVHRWTGAGFVPSGPIGGGLRTLEASVTHALVTSAEAAWCAPIPALSRPIDPVSEGELRALAERFDGLVCALRVARCPLDPALGLDVALRTLGVPRGAKHTVSTLGAAAAVCALWRGDDDAPGFTAEDSAELAGAFARGWGVVVSASVLRDAEARTRAVVIVRERDVIATWLVPHP